MKNATSNKPQELKNTTFANNSIGRHSKITPQNASIATITANTDVFRRHMPQWNRKPILQTIEIRRKTKSTEEEYPQTTNLVKTTVNNNQQSRTDKNDRNAKKD